MADQLTFTTKPELSPSHFGSPILAKDRETGRFRSFGITYLETGDTMWSNNEVWYNAWVAGLVMPKSITIKEEQKISNVLDANGKEIMENGRKKTMVVEGVKVWQLKGLKTKTQLENEDEIEVWDSLRSITKKQRVLAAHSKYEETAVAAASNAVLSEEQKTKLNATLAQYGL